MRAAGSLVALGGGSLLTSSPTEILQLAADARVAVLDLFDAAERLWVVFVAGYALYKGGGSLINPDAARIQWRRLKPDSEPPLSRFAGTPEAP